MHHLQLYANIQQLQQLTKLSSFSAYKTGVTYQKGIVHVSVLLTYQIISVGINKLYCD